MEKNDYIGTIYSKELDSKGKELGYIKGFFQKNNLDILRSNCKKGKVLQGMEYRPDKIASYYLGNERFEWLITLANGFDNGISDYYSGREILIPTERAILLLERN